jgi:Ni/Co efflux regulator RcnB
MRTKIKKTIGKVFSGTKKVIKKPFKWAAGQLEKEFRGQDENIENFRRKQERRDLGLD